MKRINRFLMAMVLRVRAQMDVQFADYTSLRSYYNPAVSGTEGQLNVVGAYSMQMAGYKGAPATMFLSADMPIYFLSPRHGGGLSFLNDVVGMFTTSKISLQYAYNVKLGLKSRIAIGANIGMISEKIDGSKLELEDTTDPAFPSSAVTGNSLDFNFGVYYTPAENLCYTALKKFRDKYGVIENVSDREYFTNSMHVPVWEKVTPFEKIDIESKLTGYSNGGCITYVELDS